MAAVSSKSGAEGKPGSGGTQADSDKGGTGPDFGKLLEGIGALAKSVSDLSVNQQASMKEVLAQNQAILQAFQTSATAPRKEEPVVPELDPDALERMSRVDLLKHIKESNNAAVQQAIEKVISPRLEQLQKNIGETGIAQMISNMTIQHKDFNDWMPEITQLANKVRGLDPEGLYTLARAQNPTKATELDKKYTGVGTGKPGEEGGFGGLKPGGTPQKVEKTDLTEADAATTAWTEVIGHLSGEDQSKLLRTEELV